MLLLVVSTCLDMSFLTKIIFLILSFKITPQILLFILILFVLPMNSLCPLLLRLYRCPYHLLRHVNHFPIQTEPLLYYPHLLHLNPLILFPLHLPRVNLSLSRRYFPIFFPIHVSTIMTLSFHIHMLLMPSLTHVVQVFLHISLLKLVNTSQFTRLALPYLFLLLTLPHPTSLRLSRNSPTCRVFHLHLLCVTLHIHLPRLYRFPLLRLISLLICLMFFQSPLPILHLSPVLFRNSSTLHQINHLLHVHFIRPQWCLGQSSPSKLCLPRLLLCLLPLAQPYPIGLLLDPSVVFTNQIPNSQCISSLHQVFLKSNQLPFLKLQNFNNGVKPWAMILMP